MRLPVQGPYAVLRSVPLPPLQERAPQSAAIPHHLREDHRRAFSMGQGGRDPLTRSRCFPGKSAGPIRSPGPKCPFCLLGAEEQRGDTRTNADVTEHTYRCPRRRVPPEEGSGMDGPRPAQFRIARTCASNLGSRSSRKSPPHLLHFPAQDSSSCCARTTTPQTSLRGMRCSVIAMNWLPVVMPTPWKEGLPWSEVAEPPSRECH